MALLEVNIARSRLQSQLSNNFTRHTPSSDQSNKTLTVDFGPIFAAGMTNMAGQHVEHHKIRRCKSKISSTQRRLGAMSDHFRCCMAFFCDAGPAEVNWVDYSSAGYHWSHWDSSFDAFAALVSTVYSINGRFERRDFSPKRIRVRFESDSRARMQQAGWRLRWSGCHLACASVETLESAGRKQQE